MKPFEYTKPKTVREALSSATKHSHYIAGGTNLVDLMKKEIDEPDKLLDITNTLPDQIEEKDNGVVIGAMVRNTAIAVNKAILESWPLLSKAILKGASPQIRNMATAGGNLLQRTRCPYFYDLTLPCNKRKNGSGCSALNGRNRMNAIIGYSNACVAVHPSDMCVALAALDAKVNILKKDGTQETMNFLDFHRLPGTNPEKDNNLPEYALITSIFIPKNNFSKHVEYLKLRDRESYAFALVSVAAALDMNGNQISEARLASGGVAHKPWRWTKAEDFLKGKEATAENFAEAARIAAEDTAPLSTNAFKVPLLKGAIETALHTCLTNKA